MGAPQPPATDDEVERCTTALLGKQGRFRPTVRLLERDGCRWVAKDYRPSWALYRLTVGAWSLRRELEALRRVADVGGVPHVEARPSRWVVVLTHFPGRDVGKTEKARQTPAFFEDLRRIVDALHARGVVHLDLRQRRNVLVQPDGRAAVIDFGASLCVRPGGALLRLLARVDDSGVLKYKRRADPGSLSDDERERLARAERRRRFWPFGRPRARRTP